MAMANLMTEQGGPSAWVYSVLWYNFFPSSDLPGLLACTVGGTEPAWKTVNGAEQTACRACCHSNPVTSLRRYTL